MAYVILSVLLRVGSGTGSGVLSASSSESFDVLTPLGPLTLLANSLDASFEKSEKSSAVYVTSCLIDPEALPPLTAAPLAASPISSPI